MKNFIPSFEEHVSEEEEKFFTTLEKEYNDFSKLNHKTKLIESLLSEKCTMLNEIEKSVLGIVNHKNGVEDLLAGTLDEEVIHDWCFEMNEEGDAPATKWHEKFVNAMKTVKDKGKQALSKGQEMIVKLGSNIAGMIKYVARVIADFLKKAWEYIKKKVDEKWAGIKDKIIEAAKPKIEKHGIEKSKEEVKNCKTMCSSTVSYITGKVAQSMAGGMAKAATVKESASFDELFEKAIYLSVCEMISEGYDISKFCESVLNEAEEVVSSEGDAKKNAHGKSAVNLPFLTVIAKKVSQFPPFKWIHDAEKFVAKHANNALEKFSQLATKYFGSPGPYTFVVIGAIFGLAAGYAIELGLKNIAEEIGKQAIVKTIIMTVPAIGWLLEGLELVAKGIWIVGVTEAAIQTTAGIASKDKSKEEKSEPKTEQ